MIGRDLGWPHLNGPGAARRVVQQIATIGVHARAAQASRAEVPPTVAQLRRMIADGGID